MIAVALVCAVLLIPDGDTIRCDGEYIRLANIDTPELRGAKCPAERRLAKVAKRRLDDLLHSGEVTIARNGRDRYRRTLAVISVNGIDVGETLIAEDLARPWEGRRRTWCEKG